VAVAVIVTIRVVVAMIVVVIMIVVGRAWTAAGIAHFLTSFSEYVSVVVE
jgi:hypothetical protein